MSIWNVMTCCNGQTASNQQNIEARQITNGMLNKHLI